jgi:sec-independent protein translocase protein TatA
MGAMDISLWQVAIVIVIVLLLFGSRRLPEMGRSLGDGMREFKDGITGKNKPEDSDEPAKLQASERDSSDDSAEPVEGEVVSGPKP